MAQGEVPITVVGNLVADPELRFTQNGKPVGTFRVASTQRIYDREAGQWKDGDSLFLTCVVWNQAAENVCESLQRGMRVVVHGVLKQRSYETREGEKRTVFEVLVDDVGPSLKNASAKVVKAQRRDSGFSGGQGSSGAYGSSGTNRNDDPWASDQSTEPPF